MSTTDRQEQATSSARDVDRILDQVGRDLAFADAIEAVNRRRAALSKLQEEARRARSRGWVWGATWESSIAELTTGGPRAATEVATAAHAATTRFRSTHDQLRATLARTPVSAATAPALQSLEEAASDLRSAVDAEESRLGALSKAYIDGQDTLTREVEAAHKHLDRFAAARFQLGAGELPYRTSECTWQDAPTGSVNGFLYLTDKRLRFEQKETITTKKFLFFTASSEDKHELMLDEPVGNIERSDDSTKGLVFKDQLVTLIWKGARIAKSTFDINSGESAKDWDLWIEELRSGQLAHRKASGVAAPPATDLPIDAPVRCSACDASLDAPVRGMTVLLCRYCGQRHDLRFA